MIGGILIANMRGDILFHRYFRPDILSTVAEIFRLGVILDDENRFPVTCINDSYSFLHIRVEDLYFGAVTNADVNAALVFEFLYVLTRLLRAFMKGKLNERTIVGKWPLVHELVEEILDYGYPQNTDLSALKLYITQGVADASKMNAEQVKKITVVATGAIPWRPPGVVYKKNQIWVDVIEKMNLMVSHEGTVLKLDVEGIIELNTNLTGMPTCEFGLNDKILVENDQKAGKKFESERIINFVPPDGKFVLMRYRLTDRVKPPFVVLSHVKEAGNGKVGYEVTVISSFSKKLNGQKVVIKIPAPPGTATCKLNIKGQGRAKYDASQQAIVWKVRNFPGESEYTLRASIELISTGTHEKWDRPPISLAFSIPRLCASGMKIRYIRVSEKSDYDPHRWVRYLTTSGSYIRRI